MHWQSQDLAVGSGFIARLGSEVFLVTARHNLAGRHWETNELLSKWSVSPDRVTIRMQVQNPGVLEWANRVERVTDEEYRPLWFEHPRFGRRVDLAVLPLASDTKYLAESFNLERPPPHSEPLIAAGDDLFVVGFPRGFTYHVGLPIWTRASVASEPAIPYKGLPLYLVDARTTTGHSGSAVVLRPGVNRAVRMRDESIVGTSIEDAWIAGLYSGRIGLPGSFANTPAEPGSTCRPAGPGTNDLDIGLVWDTGAILATAEGRTLFPAADDSPPTWIPLDDWGDDVQA
jgi:hypothetical protein